MGFSRYIPRSLSNDSCVADWGKCGGQNWTGPTKCCNTRYYCNTTDTYYSECIPIPLTPFPPAPASDWCGEKGTVLNTKLLSQQGVVNSKEIGLIWKYATDGLTKGRANGGKETCIQAISTALGECGHPVQSDWMTINDPVCSFEASGAGGIWQVTSADGDDTLLAGCSNGFDPCCNARLAYAHAYNGGGATVVPSDYCQHQKDCTQIYSDCGESNGPKWNNVTVDQTKPGSLIPDCSYQKNPWYPDGGASLEYVTIDQEPCHWGPFSMAAGGVGKEFFSGFYGWGGFLQHYLNSKAGRCDPSPQCVTQCNPNNGTFAKYPSYIQLAIDACNN